MISLVALFISSAFADIITVPVNIDVQGASCTATTNALNCGGGTPPTGCVATANPTSLSNAGGTSALSVGSCSPSPTSYSWRRNGSVVNTNASWTDTLAANPTGSPIVYGYQVTACNSSACATYPTPQLTVTVAASGGSGDCSGFARTINMNMIWANPARLFTADAGGMGPNDVVVVAFTTGGIASPTNNLPRISAAEWQSNTSTRIAVLSSSRCDFTAQAYPGASSSGSTVTVPFTVNNPNNYGYYPILNFNTTYYFNIKNAPSSGCTASGNCNMAIDLSKPGGI